MSSTFKNALQPNVGTANVTVYTCPVANVSTLLGMSVANRSNTEINVDVYLRDNSNSNTQVYLVRGIPIRSNSTFIVVGSNDQKVILEAGDKVDVVSSAAGSADVVLSAFELFV